MKLSWIFLLFGVVTAILLSAAYIRFELYINSVWLISIFVISIVGKNLENIKHITFILLFMVLVEYLAVLYLLKYNPNELPPYLNNALIFGTHFILDLITMILLKYRMRLSLKYIRKTNPENWQSVYMTHADPILYGIFFAFIIVDLAAFGENLIRNMDLFFGVSEEASKPFWSWGWVYKSYEYLKSILLACVITTLLATIFVERQRPDTPDEELDSES